MPKPESIVNDDLSSPSGNESDDTSSSTKRRAEEISNKEIDSIDDDIERPLKRRKETYTSLKTSNEKHVSFPMKLMTILSNKEHAEIISWLPHGKSFCIFNKKEFASSVLPRYFKKSKFTSFTRKLNRWRFVRLSTGPRIGTYSHHLFQRDNIPLCLKMSCFGEAKDTQMPCVSLPSTSATPHVDMQASDWPDVRNIAALSTYMSVISLSQASRQNLIYHSQMLQSSLPLHSLQQLSAQNQIQSMQTNFLHKLISSSMMVSKQHKFLQQELQRLNITNRPDSIVGASNTLQNDHFATNTSKELSKFICSREIDNLLNIQNRIDQVDLEICRLHEAQNKQEALESDVTLKVPANHERPGVRNENSSSRNSWVSKRASAA